MKLIGSWLRGIDLKNAITSALVGLIVLGLFSWLSRNNWQHFYATHTYSLNVSISHISIIAGLVLLFIIFTSVVFDKYRKIEIISAKYGVSGKYVDVTPELKEMVSGNKVNFILSNGITGGFDPAEHIHKQAIINYRYGRKTLKLTVSESDRVIIPQK